MAKNTNWLRAGIVYHGDNVKCLIFVEYTVQVSSLDKNKSFGVSATMVQNILGNNWHITLFNVTHSVYSSFSSSSINPLLIFPIFSYIFSFQISSYHGPSTSQNWSLFVSKVMGKYWRWSMGDTEIENIEDDISFLGQHISNNVSCLKRCSIYLLYFFL